MIIPEHTPIINEQECKSPRKDKGNSKEVVTHVIANTTPIVTPVVASSRGSSIYTTTNLSKVGASVTSDSVVNIQDPPYPQRLTKFGPASQPKSEFLKELQNFYVRIPLL